LTVLFWLVNCHFHQVIKKRGAGAEVSEAGAGGGVAVDAVGSVFVPPDALGDDGAGLDGFADDGDMMRPELAIIKAAGSHLQIVIGYLRLGFQQFGRTNRGAIDP
jgi:hypothetical protein